MSIKAVFTDDIVEHYKNNKDLITEDLLETLRSHGNDGKQLALEILDLNKDHEGYYLDAYGNRVSYKGILTLKKSNTKLSLSKIHETEIRKCSEDIRYFMDNYCKIVTKSGTNFPELRPYQDTYLKAMVDEEAIVSLQSRQSGKCSTFDSTLEIINKDEEYSQNIGDLFEECKKEYLE